MKFPRASRLAALASTIISATLALTGCASSGADAAPAGETRTVVDVEGTEVQVPVHPKRIVTLSEPTLDGVLALGVTPIGTVTGRGQSTAPHYLIDQAGSLPILGGVAQPNFEAIGAAKPDLILVDGTSINNNPPVVEALRKIAPVVYTGYAGGDWRDNFRRVADSLNLIDQGEQIIADYDAKVAAAKPQFEKYASNTFSIVRWEGNSAGLMLNELLPGRALIDLGLKRPANQDRIGRGHSEPVSLENLQEIDADYIFFGTLGGSSISNPNAGGTADQAGAQSALTEAEKVPGFTQLQAYQQDHIILVDGSAWGSTGGPILMNKLVDDVVAALG